MTPKTFEVGMTPQANDEFERDYGRKPEPPQTVVAMDFIDAKETVMKSWANGSKPARVRELRLTDLWVRELKPVGEQHQRDPKLTEH